MNLNLLHYREWQGEFRGSIWSVWPIARVSLANLMIGGPLLRCLLFWVLYAVALLTFFMFFFGNLLLTWAEGYMTAQPISFGKINIPPGQMMQAFKNAVNVLNGSNSTFAYFFLFQGLMVMVVLAMAGAVMVGNDFVQRSLSFYLTKPISNWHYILGKCLAIAVVVNMLTTAPALVLYFQHSSSDWRYLTDPSYFRGLPPAMASPASWELLLGILGYGIVLSVCLSIMLVAAACWMRRTMPLVMVWTSVFLFLPLLADGLVRGLQYDARFQLIDMWNNMSLLGLACLGISHDRMERILRLPQPELWEAALVLVGVCSVCLIFLLRRTRAVDVIS